MQDKLYIKYEDSHGDFHYQSISDLLDIGRLIEVDGENEGEDMQLADGDLYSQSKNKIAFIPVRTIAFA